MERRWRVHARRSKEQTYYALSLLHIHREAIRNSPFVPRALENSDCLDYFSPSYISFFFVVVVVPVFGCSRARFAYPFSFVKIEGCEMLLIDGRRERRDVRVFLFLVKWEKGLWERMGLCGFSCEGSWMVGD